MTFSRSSLIVLVLFGLLLTAIAAAPALAQDAAAEATAVMTIPPETIPAEALANSIPTPVVVGGFILLGSVLLGLIYNLERIVKIVAPLMRPEDAIALINAALPSIVDAVMNNVASRIPTEIDDKMFIEAATQRGLVVAKDSVGNYHTTRADIPATPAKPSAPYPPATGTDLGADYTLPKTDTLPNRPAPDGGASGGGTGFPPVR